MRYNIQQEYTRPEIVGHREKKYVQHTHHQLVMGRLSAGKKMSIFMMDANNISYNKNSNRNMGSVHLKNLIILILIILILIMSLPTFGDKSVGAGGLWLSHTCPIQCPHV